ncbi:unnamed protein product [Wuchereria bancrofti]|uniref:Uncharacterized protein n=1 Tax=Wuchereria bancrofti TaxID=6293 RepID=A0A3P7ERX2_WUCBA|nr:unnamed protein product [Wuchereria bancrofti]
MDPTIGCLDVTIQGQLSDLLRSENLSLKIAHDFPGFAIAVCCSVTFEHLDLDILVQNMQSEGLRQDFIQPVGAERFAM